VRREPRAVLGVDVARDADGAPGASVRRCGIVGHPVAHSVSPVLYRAVFAQAGLPWTYEAIDVAPGGLAAFVASLDEAWRGLSVTAPHKPDAFALGAPDEASRLVGASNTLVFENGGRVLAQNTDVPGVVTALAAHGIAQVDSAVVVGGGATARSVVAGLARIGLRHLVLQVRDAARASAVVALTRELRVGVTVEEIGRRVPCDLVVSTLPARAADPWAEALGTAAPAVFDVAYDPWPTALTKAAQNAGLVVVDGLDLLAGQAVDQMRLLCGADIGFDALRAVAVAELARRRTAAS